MTVAFQRMFGILERWNNKVTPSLRKPHELSYRSNKYKVIYGGPVNKKHDNKTDNSETLYSLTTEDITFVLAEKTRKPVSSYVLIQTEHPKLLIFETRPGKSFLKNKPSGFQNMDIFTYVNSKFIYMERHIRTEVNRIYHDVLTQRCILEQQGFRKTLTSATQSPDEFTYQLIKGPGYSSVIAGEVVHVVKCIQVKVKYHKTEEFYLKYQYLEEINLFFLSLRTHMLTKSGMQTNSNFFLLPMYLFGEIWYKLLPNPVEFIATTIVKHLTKATWKYTNPSSLATSGTYS